jgi:hypothetical protein
VTKAEKKQETKRRNALDAKKEFTDNIKGLDLSTTATNKHTQAMKKGTDAEKKGAKMLENYTEKRREATEEERKGKDAKKDLNKQ